MDVATSDANVHLESVEEKRDLEHEDESVVEPAIKKPRFDEEVNRVAEIVLVLSALQKIRAGKSPTELEKELMVEAKSKLVEMCQEFSPKDIIGRDAIGAVIEDLGLNGKLKDQRLGFRAPKLTISEKLSLGKRKMEESKKNPIVSTTYTSPGHSTPAMTHQWTNSEMKASAGSVNPSGSHFVAQPRMDRPQFKSDMHTGASQGPVPSGNYYANAASWSAQPHSSSSTISFGTASDSKVHAPSSSRVTDPSFRPFASQTPSGAFSGIKGVNYGQTSSSVGNNHHAEIAKLVHKVLQPRAKQNLLWNPPSREYMTKAMACQICQGTVNEVETVLICDACEKGCHLKCLHAHNMKGVPKSEWHCSRCVQLYNGKAFPPKYGRVMRSSTTSKMSSSTSEVQFSAEKKVGIMGQKVSQEASSQPNAAKPTEDSAMEQTVEAKDTAAMSQIAEAEDAATNQAVDANFETHVPTRNDDVQCNDPSEPVSKDATERSESDSANCEDKNSKITAESSLQEENSASETQNLPSQPPSLGSITDQSQQQNTTPNVQEDVQTEDPEGDKSC